MIAAAARAARSSYVALCLALLSAPLARAADGSVVPAATPEAPPKELENTARQLFRDGVKLLDDGRYEDALRCFRLAYELWDHPKILLNIATTLRALGRNAEAANAYVRYLESGAADAARRKEVETILGELALHTGRIGFSDLNGVRRISVDGIELTAAADRELWLEPGKHSIVIERATGSPEIESLYLDAAEVRRIDLSAVVVEREPETPLPEPQRDFGTARTNGTGLALLTRVDVDPLGRGAVAAGGIGYDADPFFRVTAGALLGSRRGGWLGLEWAPLHGRIRPVVGLSTPVFFLGSPYAGVSSELGVRFRMSPRLFPFARVAVAHFLRVPAGYVPTVFLPAAGLEVGL